VLGFTTSNVRRFLVQDGLLASPRNSNAETWLKCSSSRRASFSGVWCSSRKWPPQDSSRRQRVLGEELGELEEVGDAAGVLERGIELVAVAGDAQVLPELGAQAANLLDRRLQARGAARHAALVPHQGSELAVDAVGAALPADREQAARPFARELLGVAELGLVRVHGRELPRREVRRDRSRER
jgi:hypothetical protein